MWLLGGCAWLLGEGRACVVAQGGHAWLLGGHAWFLPGGHVWFLLGGMHGFSQGGVCGFSWGGVHRLRRDTVNERAVRILLECILVLQIKSFAILM